MNSVSRLAANKEKRYWDGEKTIFVVLLGSSVALPCVNRNPLWRSIYTVVVAVVTTPVCDSHHVSPEDGLALHVLETEFTHVEATQAGVLLGIGRVVPGVQLVAPKQDGLDHVTALRDLTLDAQLLLRAGQNQEAN